MEKERALVLAKPDAVQRGLVGEIIKRFENKGLKLIGIKMMRADTALIDAHYAHLKDKPFFESVKRFMQSSPVIAMAWEGYDCIDAMRIIAGPTLAREAAAGTIRGDFAMSIQMNVLHVSDTIVNGVEEVGRFFDETELFDYDKSEYIHVYEHIFDEDRS